MLPVIEQHQTDIEALCHKWIVRDDFRSDSDIDVLVSFQPEHPWSLFDLLDMQDELSALLGRPVDLVTKGSLRNPFQRHEILTTRRVLYAG